MQSNTLFETLSVAGLTVEGGDGRERTYRFFPDFFLLV